MSESIKTAMHNICDALAARIIEFAALYDIPGNSHTTYGTCIVETIADTCSKAFIALLELKNTDPSEIDQVDDSDPDLDIT